MTEKANNDQLPEVGEDIFFTDDNTLDPDEQEDEEEQ